MKIHVTTTFHQLGSFLTLKIPNQKPHRLFVHQRTTCMRFLQQEHSSSTFTYFSSNRNVLVFDSCLLDIVMVTVFFSVTLCIIDCFRQAFFKRFIVNSFEGGQLVTRGSKLFGLLGGLKVRAAGLARSGRVHLCCDCLHSSTRYQFGLHVSERLILWESTKTFVFRT